MARAINRGTTRFSPLAAIVSAMMMPISRGRVSVAGPGSGRKACPSRAAFRGGLRISHSGLQPVAREAGRPAVSGSVQPQSASVSRSQLGYPRRNVCLSLRHARKSSLRQRSPVSARSTFLFFLRCHMKTIREIMRPSFLILRPEDRLRVRQPCAPCRSTTSALSRCWTAPPWSACSPSATSSARGRSRARARAHAGEQVMTQRRGASATSTRTASWRC